MADEFFTILTTMGKNKLATAAAQGIPLKLTHMAVGDGDNGAYYLPVESQQYLKHETWRGTLNHLSIDKKNPHWIVAEVVIPDDVGGFYIREVGLFDETGALIAIGKFPESYKPILATGANKQLYVRMILEVSNAASVTLLIDPSVVLATRQYVEEKVVGEINKLDAKHLRQVIWGTHPTTLEDYGITDAVTTAQAKAAGICADLAVTNRITGDLDALLTPGEYYYDAKVNENAPSTSGLLKVWRENADEVYHIAHAWENNVYTRGRYIKNGDWVWTAWRQLDPGAGQLSYFLMQKPPSGWFICNGAALSRTTYHTLFGLIGTRFGAGDGHNTFNLPDFRSDVELYGYYGRKKFHDLYEQKILILCIKHS